MLNEELLNRTLDLMKDVEKLTQRNKFIPKFIPKFCKNIKKVDKKTLVLGSLVLFVESMDISEEQKQTMKEYIKNDIPIIIDNIIKFKNGF